MRWYSGSSCSGGCGGGGAQCCDLGFERCFESKEFRQLVLNCQMARCIRGGRGHLYGAGLVGGMGSLVSCSDLAASGRIFCLDSGFIRIRSRMTIDHDVGRGFSLCWNMSVSAMT